MWIDYFTVELYNYAIVLLVFLFFVYIIFTISSMRKNKLKHIKEKKFKLPVRSQVHDIVNTKSLRDIVKKNMGTQMRVMKYFTFFLVFIFLLIFFSLPFLSESTGAFLSILGTILAVVIGIAAKPFIENLISGIVLTISKKIRLGDTVLYNEHYGTVEDISVTHTVIKRWDWKRELVPNTQMLQKDLLNFTLSDSYIWAYVEFFVTYESDIVKVRKIALDIAKKCPYSIEKDDKKFWIMGMEKDSIKCWLATWVDSPANWWNAKAFMMEELIKEFKKNKIKTHVKNITLKK